MTDDVLGRARRGLEVVLVTVLVLSLLPSPVRAASYDSTTEVLIRTLNSQLLYIAVPITVLVEAILLYTVFRFRNAETARPTRENRRLEITWTVATALVLVFVGVTSYQVMADPAVSSGLETGDEPPADAVEVRVIGQQFLWTFEYPDADVTSQTLVLPANRTVVLRVTSRDVIHSLHVPDLGLKQDAIPGHENVVSTRITDRGEYRLYCAELCGVGHSEMLATVDVRRNESYRQWLDEQGESEDGA